MLLNNKPIVLFKVLCYNNITIIYIRNTEKQQNNIYEINNEISAQCIISKIFNSEATSSVLLYGYDCYNYDVFIINYIISHKNCKANDIYSYVKNTDFSLEKENMFKYFYCIDLRNMLFPEKSRLSLRQIAFNLNKPTRGNTFNREEITKSYEIDTLYQLVVDNYDKMKLRLEIVKSQKINVMSVDDTLFGIRYITKMYLDKTKESFEQFTSGRTQPSLFKINQFIKCKKLPQTKELRQFIEKSMELVINPLDSGKKGWNEAIITNGLKLSVGQGGIRTINNPESFICGKDEVIIKYDFTSMYPTVMCNYSLFPRHLSQDFRSLYKSIRDERIKAKMERKDVKNTMLKIAINSAIGLMNSDWNYMYDPVMGTSIRIQSMFITIQLLDLLLRQNVKILQVNVDGIFIKTKKDRKENLDKIVSSFCKDEDIIFDEETFCKMFQYSVNDYIALSDDGMKLVEKGLFNTINNYSRVLQPKVVIDAIGANLLYNIPIKTYIDREIDEYNNLDGFLLSTNVGEAFLVKHGDVVVNNQVRFYYATGKEAYRLTRSKDSVTSFADSIKSGVIVVDAEKVNKNKINRNVYYGLANKIAIQFKDKKLFNAFIKRN